jgi:hypothetical protein
MSIFSQVGNSRLFGKHKEALDLFAAGKVRDAILILVDLAEAEPTNALVCVDLGKTVLAMGMADQAVIAARQAIDLDETNTEALMLLASALEKTGDCAGANVVLRRVIELQNDPQKTIEDVEKEKILLPLTVPEYGSSFLSFTILGDSTNFTLKSTTEDKLKAEQIYITIAGEGTEDKHDGYSEAFDGEFTRERLLKSLPENIVSFVKLFPGDTFKYKLFCIRGVRDERREKEVIVTLTADASRISMVAKTSDILLRQTAKPDRILLWLSLDAASGLNPDTLPECFNKLVRRGLEVRWCANSGSLRAYMETRKEFPDALVVTADVNVTYSRCWLEQLFDAYVKEPHFIHCHCAHQMLYGPDGAVLPFAQWNKLARNEQGPSEDIFPVCSAGAVFAPEHVSPDALDVSAFAELAGGNLDAWLKAMSLKNGVRCKKVFVKSMDINKIRQDEAYMTDASEADPDIDGHIAGLDGKYHVFKHPVQQA